jgi:hypothetical protein
VPRRGGPHYTSGVAQPLRRPAEGAPLDAPPIDPGAVERAYRQERARRQIRNERRRATRRARLRFWFVLLVLLAVSVALSLTVWHEIERLFGL